MKNIVNQLKFVNSAGNMSNAKRWNPNNAFPHDEKGPSYKSTKFHEGADSYYPKNIKNTKILVITETFISAS